MVADISGYALVLGEAGWDVLGNIGRRQAPRGTLVNAIRYCLGECDKVSTCAGFNLNAGVCWLKNIEMMNGDYVFRGETSSGWRWFYRSKAKTGMNGSCP